MKNLIITVALVFFSLFSNAQDWFRFDYTIKIIDTIEGQVIHLTHDAIQENDYQLYVLTSSYSGVRKFYYDENLGVFRIVSEVMAEMKDPYLIVAKEDTLMGVLLMPQNIVKQENKVIRFGDLNYQPGLFLVEEWVNTGQKADIYFKDDKNQRKLEAAIIQQPKLIGDKDMTIKSIDRNYDYAFPFMGLKQEKPTGEKVYKLDIW